MLIGCVLFSSRVLLNRSMTRPRSTPKTRCESPFLCVRVRVHVCACVCLSSKLAAVSHRAVHPALHMVAVSSAGLYSSIPCWAFPRDGTYTITIEGPTGNDQTCVCPLPPTIASSPLLCPTDLWPSLHSRSLNVSSPTPPHLLSSSTSYVPLPALLLVLQSCQCGGGEF